MSTVGAAAPSTVGSPGAWLTGFGHGLSQIFFQSNIWTGILLLAAFAVADWRMAVLVAIGCIASTLTGRLLGAKATDVIAHQPSCQAHLTT